MSKRVMVQYLGRKKDLTLSLPYLSESVSFVWKEGLKLAKMWDDDAEALIKKNPKSYKILHIQPEGEEDKFEDLDREALDQYAKDFFLWNPNPKWKDETVRDKLREMEREAQKTE